MFDFQLVYRTQYVIKEITMQVIYSGGSSASCLEIMIETVMVVVVVVELPQAPEDDPQKR